MFLPSSPKIQLSTLMSKSASLLLWKNNLTKAIGGGKGLFDFYLKLTVHHRAKLGQKIKVGTETESMKEHCFWLTRSSRSLIQPRPTCPTVGWALLHRPSIKTATTDFLKETLFNFGSYSPGDSAIAILEEAERVRLRLTATKKQ